MRRGSSKEDVNNVDDMQMISDARGLKGVLYSGKDWESFSVSC